jgi:hypothetical protein
MTSSGKRSSTPGKLEAIDDENLNQDSAMSGCYRSGVPLELTSTIDSCEAKKRCATPTSLWAPSPTVAHLLSSFFGPDPATRTIRVDAKDIQSAEGYLSAAEITIVKTGSGSSVMSVGEDAVQCLTREDMAFQSIRKSDAHL